MLLSSAKLSGLHDLAVDKHDDAVGLAHGAQPMRDHDPRYIEIAERCADDRLRLVVERTRRLVEQQNTGPASDRAGDHDSLSLPAGKRVHAFGDHRMHAHRHALDIGIETGKPRGLPSLLERELDATANIVVEASCRQITILQHHAELPRAPR